MASILHFVHGVHHIDLWILNQEGYLFNQKFLKITTLSINIFLCISNELAGFC